MEVSQSFTPRERETETRTRRRVTEALFLVSCVPLTKGFDGGAWSATPQASGTPRPGGVTVRSCQGLSHPGWTRV